MKPIPFDLFDANFASVFHSTPLRECLIQAQPSMIKYPTTLVESQKRSNTLSVFLRRSPDGNMAHITFHDTGIEYPKCKGATWETVDSKKIPRIRDAFDGLTPSFDGAPFFYRAEHYSFHVKVYSTAPETFNDIAGVILTWNAADLPW